MTGPVLRPMRETDLPALFEIQCDPEGQRMAAFTSTANDREAYLAKHRRLLAGAARAAVLERHGFKRTGLDRGFAEARGEEIEEVLFRLD